VRKRWPPPLRLGGRKVCAVGLEFQEVQTTLAAAIVGPELGLLAQARAHTQAVWGASSDPELRARAFGVRVVLRYDQGPLAGAQALADPKVALDRDWANRRTTDCKLA
jgi:hypothetical protein